MKDLGAAILCISTILEFFYHRPARAVSLKKNLKGGV